LSGTSTGVPHEGVAVHQKSNRSMLSIWQTNCSASVQDEPTNPEGCIAYPSCYFAVQLGRLPALCMSYAQESPAKQKLLNNSKRHSTLTQRELVPFVEHSPCDLFI
jgi:hypothetical protein